MSSGNQLEAIKFLIHIFIILFDEFSQFVFQFLSLKKQIFLWSFVICEIVEGANIVEENFINKDFYVTFNLNSFFLHFSRFIGKMLSFHVKSSNEKWFVGEEKKVNKTFENMILLYDYAFSTLLNHISSLNA